MPDGTLIIPGGPSFSGTPQPPDVPPDPSGEDWRGPPGPTGPQGPPGPQGLPGDVAAGVSSFNSRAGAVSLVPADMTAAFGSVVASSATDLSKHITLYSPGYGFSVTSGRVNVVVASVDRFSVASTGTTVGNVAVAANQIFSLSALAGQTLSAKFTNGALENWALIRDNAALGGGLGARFGLAAYDDAGAFVGYAFQGQRGSGPTGQGAPHFPIMRPYTISSSRATYPGGTTGNDINTPNADVQPVTTLGNNPLSVTSGSPLVTITWTGCGLSTGAINGLFEAWVNLAGVVAVGGITPTGWLKATRVNNDTFTVIWTSNATGTATGGGAAVTVQPSFSTAGDRYYHVATSPGSGYSVQYTKLYAANPAILTPVGTASPQYQQEWRMVFGPPDAAPAGTNSWGIVATETDLINRGVDPGYAPSLYDIGNPSIGFWSGAYRNVGSWVAGGGAATNWNTVYAVFGQWGVVGNYVGFSVQGNALVGAARDPTGHGGVGFVSFGSYTFFGAGKVATTAGTSTVTYTSGTNNTLAQVNGGQVYIPTVTTISGVTVGGGSYTMANVTPTSFQVTGTGTAAASVVGGLAQWIAFANLVPYAPAEFRGSYKRGITTTEFRSEDGSIIRTQPGNGIIWDDGTASASVTGTALSAGNLNVVLTAAGTGNVLLGKMPPNAANDAAAASASVPVGGIYRSGSQLMIRVT